VREHGRRAGSVADRFAGSFGGLAHHLRAEVLFVIRETDLFSDGHPVVAN